MANSICIICSYHIVSIKDSLNFDDTMDLDYGRFDPKDLQFTEQLDKNPNQYPNDKKLRAKVLALELGIGIGEIVYWYESLSNERGYSTKVKDISIKKYKEIL